MKRNWEEPCSIGHTLYIAILTFLLALMSLLPVALSAPAYASTVKEEWETHYVVGRFHNSEPPKPDQIFRIQYKAINGTVESFDVHQVIDDVLMDSVIIAKVRSSDSGTLEIKFPRNFPYTNAEGADIEWVDVFDGEYRNVEHTKTTNECFFVFAIPFAGDAEIMITNASILIKSPYHGDEVSDTCIPKTVTDRPQHQVMAGVAVENVRCPEGLQLVIGPKDRPYCATLASVEILKVRWNL